ncbi:MAG: hypothetical protein ACNA8W_21095 [Bradymonadaceae bacterium]
MSRSRLCDIGFSLWSPPPGDAGGEAVVQPQQVSSGGTGSTDVGTKSNKKLFLIIGGVLFVLFFGCCLLSILL